MCGGGLERGCVELLSRYGCYCEGLLCVEKGCGGYCGSGVCGGVYGSGSKS